MPWLADEIYRCFHHKNFHKLIMHSYTLIPNPFDFRIRFICMCLSMCVCGSFISPMAQTWKRHSKEPGALWGCEWKTWDHQGAFDKYQGGWGCEVRKTHTKGRAQETTKLQDPWLPTSHSYSLENKHRNGTGSADLN